MFVEGSLELKDSFLKTLGLLHEVEKLRHRRTTIVLLSMPDSEYHIASRDNRASKGDSDRKRW
jgi:hypothetical protein